ncbi:hypothetical protein KAU33_14460 [Candidatus Dependentiae bacterium]|nr:hypothetical protein [Candidatus Dependentiae bacterium]
MIEYSFSILSSREETLKCKQEKFHDVECCVKDINDSGKNNQQTEIVPVLEKAGYFFPDKKIIKKFPEELRKKLIVRIKSYLRNQKQQGLL